MGADGGTIPTRDELVKTRQKPEQKDKNSVRIYRWQYCNLTQQPLVRPIVACEQGRLYNKEAIIEKLLENKSGMQENGDKLMPEASTDHIRSLKDVKELQLTDNPAYDKKSKEGSTVGGAGFLDRLISPYICPVAGLEMSGRFKFVFDWSSGKVYSERALKIVNKDKATQIAEENLIVLNPEEKSEDAEMMLTKMEARRARAKALKKAAKAEKRKHADVKGTNSDKMGNMPPPNSVNGSNSSQNAILLNDKNNSKRSKTLTSQKAGISSKVLNKTPYNFDRQKQLQTALDSQKDRSKSSVQNDATKSEVYKALFDTHESAKDKRKGANWVTFDPRYN